MARSASGRLLRVDDLYAMPEDGRRYELQGGIVVCEPLPGFRHGWVVANVAGVLRQHVAGRDVGVVLAGDSGFILGRDPDTVRGPDVAFVSRERIDRAGRPVRAFPGAPDLAVEVLSPTNTAEAIHAKVADYLAAGTRLVWIVDPDRETVTVHRSLLAPQVLGRDEEIDGQSVVPGLRARVAAFFEV
jgi:Uma2 family endonuclease